MKPRHGGTCYKMSLIYDPWKLNPCGFESSRCKKSSSYSLNIYIVYRGTAGGVFRYKLGIFRRNQKRVCSTNYSFSTTTHLNKGKIRCLFFFIWYSVTERPNLSTGIMALFSGRTLLHVFIHANSVPFSSAIFTCFVNIFTRFYSTNTFVSGFSLAFRFRKRHVKTIYSKQT